MNYSKKMIHTKFFATVFFCVLILNVFSAADGSTKSAAEQPKKNQKLCYDVSVLGVTPQQTSLYELPKIFGSYKLFERGDAGEYMASACYYGKDSTTVVFNSSELGGAGRDVTNISIYQDKSSYPNNSLCLFSEVLTKELALNRYLYLGISRKSILNSLGVPKSSSLNKINYEFFSKKNIKEVQYDDTCFITVKLLNDKAVFLEVSRIISN